MWCRTHCAGYCAKLDAAMWGCGGLYATLIPQSRRFPNFRELYRGINMVKILFLCHGTMKSNSRIPVKNISWNSRRVRRRIANF